MKSYLTEADAATTVETTASAFRRPFKLIQNFLNSNMSSTASSPLKTLNSRPRKWETSTQLKDAQSKNRTSALMSRQAKNSSNHRSKSPNLHKKQDKNDSKSRISESSDGSVSSVGSLTSSPKWSHIKNKFEGSELTSNKVTSPRTETKKSSISLKTAKDFSANLENNSYIHKNRYLSARKDVEKKTDTPATKLESSLSSSKLFADKTRLNSTHVKNEFPKLKGRCSSPKNTNPNIPLANISSLHSNHSVKKLSNASSKTSPFSSNTGSPEGSVKSSRCSSPNTSSSSSTVKMPNSVTKSSSDKSVNITLKNSSDASNDSRSTTNRTSFSNLNSSCLSKRISQDFKSSSFSKYKVKHEDKPILSFNQCSQPNNEPSVVEKKIINQSTKSETGKSCASSTTSSTYKTPQTNMKEITNTASSKKQVAENVEKIKDLTKKSQTGPKTVWVKDATGNWVKKADAEVKTISSSKVASLRSKFMEPNSVPITKSSTTSSVPSNHVQNSRPIAKSSTTSSISDKTFLRELTHKLITDKDVTDRSISTDGPRPSDKTSSQDKDDKRLSIVQRAVLSFEGNIAQLSPETQRRLQLVSERVHAQTDDVKIRRAKTKNTVHTSTKTVNSPETNTDSTCSKKTNNVPNKSNAQDVSEPALPARNFLNRYQRHKPVPKESIKKSIDTDDKSKLINPKDSQLALSTAADNCTTKESRLHTSNIVPIKNDCLSNNKSITKFTMNLNLPNGHIDMKTLSDENEYSLQPNSSFLWRRPEKCPSEVSKSSTASSVSLTSSDYRNYYDVDNYYSSLELEIDKGSEISEEHIYIDSQGSNSSDNYALSTCSDYQNVSNGKSRKGSHDEWTDASEDDYRKNSVSSNQSSVLRKKKNKRYTSHRESISSFARSQSEQRNQMPNDTYSFTDSSDTLINDEIGNESACDLSDVNHLYDEPVYESLGNYLLSPEEEEENYENCSNSLSPDEPENGDFMQCSITSIESAEGSQLEKEEGSKQSKIIDEKNLENKKSSNKISQLKRHLSWTKNDIRLELSSKFNRIKIKKNGRNSTEIGLKMQDTESIHTSPKKKTFIKCILRQKSAGSIPLKRSPSPKREGASLFYVQLTMGREKQRPSSDSVIPTDSSNDVSGKNINLRKQSDSAITVNAAMKHIQEIPRSRKFNSGPIIQRPKTPPPLPPVQANNNKVSAAESCKKKCASVDSLLSETNDVSSELYAVLDQECVSVEKEKQLYPYENEVLKFIHAGKENRISRTTSGEDSVDKNHTPSRKCSNAELKTSDLNLSLLQNFHSENLKSPFEEEPMYQFYQKDVQQRATLWYSVDGSESEFEDDVSSKLSDPDYQSLKRPVLQSQLSAMDLVHGDGGQRRLWCEVPEVIQSGILKNITPNDRKIQEAMFEVITSEASYLKSLNFLIEHFVQCTEFSGDYTEKHVLDKRERHVLFSDIQPVRDVSASLLGDLEKRWLKDIVLSDICDILYHHAKNYFSVYVKYCSNQLYQERLLRELKEKRPEFVTVLKKLEANAVCQGLDMHSFLMLPMQRITRLPLLIDAIFRRLTVDSPIYESCKICLATVNKIVAQCNEGACKMQRMEEMLVISQQIDFNACKGLGLLSASRWLVKKGELIQLLMDNANRRTFSRNSRWCKIQLYLFLFTDLLVVTRKKSDDSYVVVDYCPRNMLQVMPVDENTPPLSLRLPSSYRNVFQLILLNNRDGKTVEMLLSCLLESDRTRWMSAVMPAKSENPDEKIYEEWDCPQVQCTHAYNAQQPDELSLEEADVVNVFKKMSDGWFEGERIRDGIRGWFPSSHTVEIINSHVRARNLHQRYRLLMLSQTYLEEQYKAQAQNKK